MAGAPPGFQAALNRKYDIQQQNADAALTLARAQAGNITASTPFENALRASQAAQANATASTVNPLAQASIAATQAGIGETNARAGYFGAQTRSSLYDLGSAPDELIAQGYRKLQQGAPYAIGRDGAGPSVIGTPGVHSISLDGPPSLLSPTQGANSVNPDLMRQYASGTPNVPAPGQTITNGSWTGPTTPPPPPTPLPPTPMTGTALRLRLGMGKPMPGYAMGTANVDNLGSYYNNGGDTGVGDAGVIVGGGVPGSENIIGGHMSGHYAKGTSKVSHRGGGHAGPPPPMMSPPGPMGTPPGVPAQAQTAPAMPGPMGPGGAAAGAPGMPGLAGMLQAAMGANKVPGQMPPPGQNTDVVPSMLTPGEAVVNRGGINHIPGGREAIAKANAKGMQDMGMRRGMVKPEGRGHAVHVHIHMGK